MAAVEAVYAAVAQRLGEGQTHALVQRAFDEAPATCPCRRFRKDPTT